MSQPDPIGTASDQLRTLAADCVGHLVSARSRWKAALAGKHTIGFANDHTAWTKRTLGGGFDRRVKQLFALDPIPDRITYNVARWVRVLALPEAFRTCRGNRLRSSFFNVPARVVRTGRRLYLRLACAYRHADSFIAALKRLRALPMFA